MTAKTEQQAKAVAREAKQTLAQLQRIDYTAVPLDTLRQMLENIDLQLRSEVESLHQLKHQVEVEIEAANPDAISDLKERLAQHQNHLEDLNTRRQRLYDTLQRQIIRERLATKFGSPVYVRLIENVVMVLILLMLGLLTYEFAVGSENLPPWLSSDRIFHINTTCCAIFMAEFFLRLSCAESRRWFWKNHWVDFVTSIPIPGEAQLIRFGRIARVARIARALRVLRFLRLLRILLLLWRGLDKLGDVINVKLMKRTLFWGVGVMVFGSLLVFAIEGPQSDESGHPISSWTDALWWSFTTVVTGGFGDIHNPTTVWGRLLTVLLIIMGMVLVGVFTATLMSLYVGENSEEMQRYQEAMNERLHRLEMRLEDLIEQLSDGSKRS